MEYQTFLTDTVTKDYKKVGGVEVDKINKEAATIAKKLKLDETIDAMGLNNGYLTLKGHKPNVNNRLDFRLINPCKSQIGRISKKILEDINRRVRDSCKVCQGMSTDNVLNCFVGIQDKRKKNINSVWY